MTATEETMVVIDGCGMPRGLYDFVKGQARATNTVQTVGVDYQIPAEMRHQPGESNETTWALADSRYSANMQRMRAGEGCSYIIGMSAERLRELANHSRDLRIAMILHIAPWGD